MFSKITIQLFTTYCLLFTAYSFSQEYRNSGFVKPMNLPFNLAGSFGEPRPDHFHSGIDIKTNGMEGEPVFAVYDGYISRIRVSPYGYGRAIYITHPNGFTTVYGHLSRFYSTIEKYIHTQHYAQQKSELDLTLDASNFSVRQNDTIAFSGNTGGSTAPHLHFEVRNTKTEHALNPLDFYPGSFYIDTIPPQLNILKYFYHGRSIYQSSSGKTLLVKNADCFTSQDSIFFEQDSTIAFSLEGYDKQDTSENKNGIQNIQILQENRLVFEYNLGEIDFDKTRMCNAFLDYEEMMNGNGYYYNCYQTPNNQLMFYPISKGILKLKDGKNKFQFIVSDYNKNKSLIDIIVFKNEPEFIYDTAFVEQEHSVYKYIEHNKKDSIKNGFFKMTFPSDCFYDDVFLELHKSDSSCFYLQNFPLQKAAKIEFNSSIKKNRKKIIIVRKDFKGKETALKTTFDKTNFYAETKELGSFYLKHDTTKPVIEISNLIPSTRDQIQNQCIQVKVLDNLSGIDSYNGYIDNKWVNFYYEAKNDLIQYHFDEYCPKGEHLLRIVVTDKVGNKTMIQQKFIY